MGIFSGKVVQTLTYSALIVAIVSPFVFFTSQENENTQDLQANTNNSQVNKEHIDSINPHQEQAKEQEINKDTNNVDYKAKNTNHKQVDTKLKDESQEVNKQEQKQEQKQDKINEEKQEKTELKVNNTKNNEDYGSSQLQAIEQDKISEQKVNGSSVDNTLKDKVDAIQNAQTQEQKEAYTQSLKIRQEQVDAAVKSIADNSRLYLPPMLSTRALVVYFAPSQNHAIDKANNLAPKTQALVKNDTLNHTTLNNNDHVDSISGASYIVDKNDPQAKNLVGIEYLAKKIQSEINASLYSINTVHTYPQDSAKLKEISLQEQTYKSYPELTDDNLLDLNQFDTIYLCYTNWWRDMPRPIYSFLRKYDLSGKTIVPITLHNGDGFSNSINEIATSEPHAIVYRNGLLISKSDLQDQELTTTLIHTWLKKLAKDFD